MGRDSEAGGVPRRSHLGGLARLALAVGLVTSAVSGCTSSGPTSPPGFSSTGSMSVARLGHVAALLASGKVLVAGGYKASTETVASAELYDPGSGTFGATGSMATQRAAATATALSNGKVLVAGGYYFDAAGNTIPLASAELYDPGSGTFTATGSMAAARYNHTATLLPDGRVLIAGGTGDRVVLSSAEIFDPASGTFSATGALTAARTGHTATALQNGKVLVAGGSHGAPGNPEYLASAELFDPGSGTFAATGSMAQAGYSRTAVRLNDGRVLVAGGLRLGSPPDKVSLASAELFDPAGVSASATGSLAVARSGHAAVLLQDGRVLVAGGATAGNGPSQPPTYLASVELFDASGSFVSGGTMVSPRSGASATLLQDGRVLIAGGGDSSSALATAEVYRA